jgi:hypothetical protein
MEKVCKVDVQGAPPPIKWVTKRGALLVFWPNFKPLAIKGGAVFTPKIGFPFGGLRLPFIPKVHALQGGGPWAQGRYVAGLTWCGIEKRLSWSRFAYTDDEPTCKTCIRAMKALARRGEK